MSQDLSNHRKNYKKQELLESNCPKKPLRTIPKLVLNSRRFKHG